MPATAPAPPTLSQIHAWSTDHLESAAAHWETTADTWEHAFTAIHRETPTPGGTPWTGAGADAAVMRTGTDRLVAVGAADSLHAAAKAARYGAGEIAGARQLALQAIAAAQAAGFDVREDLSVSSRQPVPGPLQGAVQAQAQAHAAAIRAQAAALLAVDEQVGGDVNAAIAGVASAQFDDTSVTPADPRHTKDPTIQLVDNHTVKDSPADDSPIPPGGWSSDPVMEEAQRIAYGHAWDKHAEQFPGMTRDDLANLIHDMMTGNPKTDPDLHVGPGERNTTVMYKNGILVIHDPANRDGGTIFKPDNGYQDFLRYTAPIINVPPNIPTPTHMPQPVGPTQTSLPRGVPLPQNPPTPLLPPWLADPSPPGFQVAPPGQTPGLLPAPWDVPDMPAAPVGPTTVASGTGGPVLPPVDKDVLGWSAIAGVGAAILSGIGSVGSFLAHPFAPPA
jgi:hypothetical protein